MAQRVASCHEYFEVVSSNQRFVPDKAGGSMPRTFLSGR